jgi:Bacterial Ig domain
VFRRTLLLTTMALAALALAVTPAFAGEEPDPTAAPPAQPSPSPTPAPPAPVVHGSAKLRTSQGCLTNNEAKASVSGKSIASVAFYVDGRKVKTVSSPDASGRYTFTMSCSHLSIGTHRARAAVSFESGVTPTQRTMLFQITRARAAIPQFAG